MNETNSQHQPTDMPKFKCHKEVWGLKIAEIDIRKNGAFIIPEDKEYPPFLVSDDYLKKHDPKVGGYFVVYEGGYRSFSPAEVFEEGYTLKHPAETAVDQLESHIVHMVHTLKNVGTSVDQRLVSIAATDLEKGIMVLRKSVTG